MAGAQAWHDVLSRQRDGVGPRCGNPAWHAPCQTESVTYRRAPCHHCGARSAEARCRDCDQLLCELCAIDGRCPSCWREQLAAKAARPKRRRFVGILLTAGALTAILVGYVGMTTSQKARAVEQHATKLRLRAVQRGLASYGLDHHDCPDVIDALYSRAYLDHPVTTDAWGQPLDYRCLPRVRGRGIRLSSSGPDRQAGTTDDIRLDHEIRW